MGGGVFVRQVKVTRGRKDSGTTCDKRPEPGLNLGNHINELQAPRETEPPGCFGSANEVKVSGLRQL